MQKMHGKYMESSKLLKELINFKSITPNDDGCLSFLKELLEGLGFECHLIEFHEEGLDDVKNLYARLGKNGINFCFAGHIDVVPAGNETLWKVPPFSGAIIDDVLYGRGAVDMKGALAAFISVLATSIKSGTLNSNNSVSFLITADEEGIALNGTKKMIPWLEAHNEKIDWCIIGEPTSAINVGDTIKIGARGSITLTIEVMGKQGHVAYHELADNPITTLTNIIKELKETSLDDGNLYFQPSNLEFTDLFVGNEVENLIPGAASARCNIRFGNMHTAKSLASWAESICKKHTKNFKIKWHSSGEAFLTNHDKLAPLVATAIKEVANIEPKINTLGGTSDARFLTNYCPTVELGLLNKTAHQVNESVSLADLNMLCKIYQRILHRAGLLI